MERYKFYTRSRHAGESVKKFIAELRLLSEFCEFGNVLDDMIRDRLVCGINDSQIQQRLLIEPNLLLSKATQLAQGIELAKQDSAEMNKDLHSYNSET